MGLGTGMSERGGVEYRDDKFEKLLRHAKIAQQSIQMVSHWMLERRAFMAEVVTTWSRLMRECGPNHQIVFLYIANDAMQVGARKYGKNIAQAFEGSLVETVEFVMRQCEEKVKRCLMKVVGIWKERRILTPQLLEMIENVCAGRPAVDKSTLSAENVDEEKEELKAQDAFLDSLLTEESIERALEGMPEVTESLETTLATQRIQDLVAATISADLLSDRMFQLQSNLSNFHRAVEAFEEGQTDEPNLAADGKESADPEQDQGAPSGGNICWSMMEQQVYELDIEKSRDHVQQYRDYIEEQTIKREELLEQLRTLSVADLFGDHPIYRADMAKKDKECEALEQAYRVCSQAVFLEKKQRAEKEALMQAQQPVYSAVEDTYNTNSYDQGHNHQYENSRNHGRPQLERRHSSTGFYQQNNNAMSPRYSGGNKRPKLHHSHSMDSQSHSRWHPPPQHQQQAPVHDAYDNFHNFHNNDHGNGYNNGGYRSPRGRGYDDRDRDRGYQHRGNRYGNDRYDNDHYGHDRRGDRW
ncbi:TPA: hypothetical protein N0F65_003772 [Lagenidium giganteum]|uniref:CID domain-containing protein n=1 Tax=Lagenidium giganteum TaxID=4803 RepID=A0AAV2YH56_9STRA|nr:TPA: hypothetical protein N0F65_003772 [Lagenidium giganteum]